MTKENEEERERERSQYANTFTKRFVASRSLFTFETKIAHVHL